MTFVGKITNFVLDLEPQRERFTLTIEKKKPISSICPKVCYITQQIFEMTPTEFESRNYILPTNEKEGAYYIGQHVVVNALQEREIASLSLGEGPLENSLVKITAILQPGFAGWFGASTLDATFIVREEFCFML